jgi:hypothetical protein
VHRDARTLVDQLERTQRGLAPRSEQRQTVNLSEYQVSREQRNSPLDGGTECAVRRCVVLVAPAAQRDPRSAIDE